MILNVWTDGGCRDNGSVGNIGAWAIWTGSDSKTGHKKETTNNQMELTAVLEGLKHAQLSGKKEINIFSDSAYVVNCFKDKWYEKWLRNGFIGTDKNPVKNKELWQEILEIYFYLTKNNVEVNFFKVKGHITKESELKKEFEKFVTKEKKVDWDEFVKIVYGNNKVDTLLNATMDNLK